MPSRSSRGLIALRAGSIEWPTQRTWIDLTQFTGPQIGIASDWWLTDSSLAYAQTTDKTRICTIDLTTMMVTVTTAPGPTKLYSGGGVWASQGEGGYWDSWGPNARFDQRGWIPYAVDNLTGAVAVLLPDWTFAVYEGHADPLQATLTPLLSGVVVYQASFAFGVLTLYSGGNWYHWTKAAGLTYTGSLTPQQVDPGGRFCSGFNLGGSPNYGQIVWADWLPKAAIDVGWVFNYNAVPYVDPLNPNLVQIIGSRGPGELPGEQQIFTIDLAAHTLDGQPWTIVDVTGAPVPPDPPVPPIPLESDMIVLKRSRLSVPSKNFPRRTLCLMNNGEFLHVDPATMGVYQSADDDDRAAWITTPGSGAARLDIEAYFIEAKVDEKA